MLPRLREFLGHLLGKYPGIKQLKLIRRDDIIAHHCTPNEANQPGAAALQLVKLINNSASPRLHVLLFYHDFPYAARISRTCRSMTLARSDA